MAYEIGQKVFVFGRRGTPRVSTIEKANSRFVTVTEGDKFHLHTGHEWGDHYSPKHIRPWSAEEEVEYANDRMYEQVTLRFRALQKSFTDRRVYFRDLPSAEAAVRLLEEFLISLSELEPPKG